MAVEIKQVRIGWRSRLRVKLLRTFFKPLVARMGKASPERGRRNESSNVTPLRT